MEPTLLVHILSFQLLSMYTMSGAEHPPNKLVVASRLFCLRAGFEEIRSLAIESNGATTSDCCLCRRTRFIKSLNSIPRLRRHRGAGLSLCG